MKFIVFTVLTLIQMHSACANFNIFNPIKDQEIRDLSFDVRSKNVGELISQKLMLKENKDFILRFYWVHDHNLDYELVSKFDGVADNILNEIANLLYNKINTFLLQDYVENIKNYKKIKSDKNMDFYQDTTGLQEFDKLIVKTNELNIQIQQKNPEVSENIDYYFVNYPWGKEQKILEKVLKRSEELLQITTIESSINYQNYNNFWFPEKIQSKVEQELKISKQSDKKSIRVIMEEMLFENVIINQNQALKWFAKKK